VKSAAILHEEVDMATLGDVEDAIRDVEEFDVVWVHDDTGRDARRDRAGYVPYGRKHKFNGDRTVTDFIRNRLGDYTDDALRATVRDGRGNVAHGGTQIKKVRASYL
jgi:hypothetical protein